MTGYEIVDAVERAMSQGNFGAIDQFLSGLEPDRMSVNQTITLLTICWHGRGHLTELVPFYLRARVAVAEVLGPARAAALLRTRDPR